MKYFLTILAALVIAPSLAAHGESIALVDTQAIINQSIVGKAAKANLEGRIKKAEAKLAQLKGDFDKQRQELEKQASILSGSALETRKEALRKKQLELQRVYQDTQEELARANEQELSKVVNEVKQVVETLAKERKYAFVFEKDRQSVLYSSDRIDISSEVVKILDKKKVAL